MGSPLTLAMAMIRSLLGSVTKASDNILKVAKNNALTHKCSAFYTVNYAKSNHSFTNKMACRATCAVIQRDARVLPEKDTKYVGLLTLGNT